MSQQQVWWKQTSIELFLNSQQMLFYGTPFHILVIYRRTPHAVTSLLQLSPCSMRCVFSAVISGLNSILPHWWQIPGMPWRGMLQCCSRLGDKPTFTLVCIWEIMLFKIQYCIRDTSLGEAGPLQLLASSSAFVLAGIWVELLEQAFVLPFILLTEISCFFFSEPLPCQMKWGWNLSMSYHYYTLHWVHCNIILVILSTLPKPWDLLWSQGFYFIS